MQTRWVDPRHRQLRATLADGSCSRRSTDIRDSQFEALLRSDRLDSYALKHACLRGIPDNVRAETWRHLLGIVQLDSAAKGDCAGSGWHAREESKLRHRKQYNELASELLERVAASAPIDVRVLPRLYHA